MKKTIVVRLKPQIEAASTLLNSINFPIIVMRSGRLVYSNDFLRNLLSQAFPAEDFSDAGSENISVSIHKLFPGLGKNISQYDSLDSQKINPINTVFNIGDIFGKTFSVFASPAEWIDGMSALILTMRDISDEIELKQKLFNLAYIDPLTEAPNRQRLKEDFDAVFPLIESGKERGALAIFDLDNFKNINDTYGHNTGDTLLRRISDYIGSLSGFRGRFYRLGGDEFVLFFHGKAFPGSEMDDGRAYFDNLLSEIVRVFTLPDGIVSCTLSMGISLFPKHAQSYSELLRKADIALYHAKKAGRNRKVFFDRAFDEPSSSWGFSYGGDSTNISAPKTFFIAEP